MLLWILLFILIIAVSFALAVRSLREYREQPAALARGYSLYLVGNPQALTPQMLDKLHRAAGAGKLSFSLERIFKGSKRALTVFAPAGLFAPFAAELGLSEIEEYSRKTSASCLAWEVGAKDAGNLVPEKLGLTEAVPQLLPEEEFWWQLVLRPQAKLGLFQVNLRAVFLTSDPGRVRQLESKFAAIGRGSGLALLPQAYPSGQLVKFYRERSFTYAGLADKRGVLAFVSPQLLPLLGL